MSAIPAIFTPPLALIRIPEDLCDIIPSESQIGVGYKNLAPSRFLRVIDIRCKLLKTMV
jgi:hypothetical protein